MLFRSIALFGPNFVSLNPQPSHQCEKAVLKRAFLYQSLVGSTCLGLSLAIMWWVVTTDLSWKYGTNISLTHTQFNALVAGIIGVSIVLILQCAFTSTNIFQIFQLCG